MAKLWYGHFDSTPDDRRRLMAEDWARYFRSMITSGVRNGGEILEITTSDFMNVKMNTGMANVEGYIFLSEEDNDGRFHEIEIPTAHNNFPRIDRVVLRLDRTIEARKITPIVLLGTAKNNPVPPDLLRNNIFYDISLARIKVDANTTKIDPSNIADERFDPDVCGLINSILGVDSSHWQRQFDDLVEALRMKNDDFLAEQDDKWDIAVEQLKTDREKLLQTIGYLESLAFTRIQKDFDAEEYFKGCTYKTKYDYDDIGDIKKETSEIYPTNPENGTEKIADQIIIYLFDDANNIIKETKTINISKYEAIDGDLTIIFPDFTYTAITTYKYDEIGNITEENKEVL